MPLPAWRALLAAALIDDPGDDRGRAQLLNLLTQLVASGNETERRAALAAVRSHIATSAGPELPVVLDPFCGGGSTLVEAVRLGLPARGSD